LVCKLWEDCRQGGREGVREVCAREAEVLRLQQRWGEVSREASRMEEDVRRREEGEEEEEEEEAPAVEEEDGWTTVKSTKKVSKPRQQRQPQQPTLFG